LYGNYTVKGKKVKVLCNVMPFSVMPFRSGFVHEGQNSLLLLLLLLLRYSR